MAVTDPELGEGSYLTAVLGRGVVPSGTPVVAADDAGLTRGDGCFEGLHLRDGAIDKIDAHFARMTRSAAALGLPYDEPAWRALCAEAVAAWPHPGEAAVKFVLTRGPASTGTPTGFITITPVPSDYARQRREGLRVISLPRGTALDSYADAPWLLGGVKTLSYAVNMAAQREAARRGVDEVLFVATDGSVLEAPTGSVVWASGRTLSSTPLGTTGILAGTTQALLFEHADAAGWTTKWATASIEDLHDADVVWVMSSVRGPVDVVELDGVPHARVPEVDAEIRRLCGF